MTEPILLAAADPALDIRSLPKVSLHDHLDGGLRPATIIELAGQAGHELPSTDPVALGEWFRESADSGSLVRYLETFDHTIAVMQTREGLARVASGFQRRSRRRRRGPRRTRARRVRGPRWSA